MKKTVYDDRWTGQAKQVWLSINDEMVEDTWVDHYSGEPINYTPPFTYADCLIYRKQMCIEKQINKIYIYVKRKN